MGVENILVDREPRRQSAAIGNSIMTGVVKNNWDKEHPGQIQVELLIGESGKTTTQWIRVMTPYGGNGYGEYFLPEINTEVVIGFLGGESSSPVMLGCLWNQEDKLPEGKANEKNSVKSIRTKGGHEILFDETKDQEKIEVITNKKLDLCLDDKQNMVTIKDGDSKNMIQMDMEKGVITIQADKKIVLKAGGDEMAVLDGSGKKASLAANNIDVKAKQGLALEGQNTNLKGTVVEMKAQSSMKAESSAILQLKGAMCKIN